MLNTRIFILICSLFFTIRHARAAETAWLATDTPDIMKPVALLMPLEMARVAEIVPLLPSHPRGFGETYHNRGLWDQMYRDPRYAQVIKKAEILLNKPFPAWDDEKYLLYFTKGTRPEGEKMMSDRSGWLTPLVWAECLENKGRFVPTIEMVLNELIHQKSWSLPAHDKKKQNIEGRYYTVDLGASVLAENIAQAVYLLDDKLSAKVKTDVLAEMYKRVFSPVLNSIATGNDYHYWLTWTNNWNSVCLAGVTGAALAIIPDVQDRAKFVYIAERYSKNSIAGFTNEGYCTEGLGYYAYGFGHYILLRESVLQATNGRLDLFADPKIKRIAAYAPNLEIINGIYPNIADCHAGLKAPADILWYCSRNLNLGLKVYDNLSFAGATGNLVEDIMHTFPNSASIHPPNTGVSELAPGLRSYFSQAGVLIERPTKDSKGILGAALKGGNNNEIHNHNDVGSYSIAVGDEMLMGDPGGQFTYTAKTFGPNRYDYKILASYGHPVPLVAGVQQQEGAIAQAKILRTSFTENQDEMVMDIASAYPAPSLEKLIRKFTYERMGAGALIVQDTFQFKGQQAFELALITRVRWKQIAPDQIEFEGNRAKMVATIRTPNGFSIKSETIEDNAPAFTRIGIVLPPSEQGVVTITFNPQL